MTVKKETKKATVKKATVKKPTKKQLEANAARAAEAAEAVIKNMPGRNGGGIYHGTINMAKKLKFW